MKDCLICLVAVFSVSVPNTMAVTGSETREPAFLLRPRNFNPHPYENALLHSAHSQTPHIFRHLSAAPPQFVPIGFGDDHHPYNIIKSQRDFLQRPPTDNDQRNFKALAKHAQKILQHPDPIDNLNKKYAFTYTANDIYHTQQQDTRGLVKGSYEVPLPDGRIQVVHYTADDDGYHPEISYKGEPLPQPPPQPQAPIYYQAPPAPRGNVIVYPNEEEDGQEEEVEAPKSYYSQTVTTSTPHAVQYTGYGLLAGLPKPYGTVRTIGPVLQAQVATDGPKYGHIQYATYEDEAGQSNPIASNGGNVYYEK